MKALKLALLTLALTPAAFAEDAKPVDPLEACKAKVAFQYHFEMMQIEGQEMRGELTHSAADSQKSARHLNYQGALAVCEDEHKKN